MKDAVGGDLDPEVRVDPEEPDPAGTTEGVQERALVRGSTGGLVPADPFRQYLAEIRRYPPLDADEERELARRYRETGDRQALLRLITANLRMVVRVAFSFRRAARNMLDLVQEGNLGLLRAIDRYDPELGVRLPTYAAWWVRAFMVKFLLDNVRLVRVGTTNARRRLLRNLRKERQRLEGQGFEVGPKMLAEHFGVTETDVVEVQQALDSRDVSLDEPIQGDEDRRRAEALADDSRPDVEETVSRRELQERAEAVFGEFRRDLSERELAVLDGRILSEAPLTLQELGDRFGTTREAVRQQETRLMRRLEEFVRERLGDLGQVRIGPD